MILASVSSLWNRNMHKIRKSHWNAFHPLLQRNPHMLCDSLLHAGMALPSLLKMQHKHFWNPAPLLHSWFGYFLTKEKKNLGIYNLSYIHEASRGERQAESHQAIPNSFQMCPIIKQQCSFIQTSKSTRWRDCPFLDLSYPSNSSIRKQIIF